MFFQRVTASLLRFKLKGLRFICDLLMWILRSNVLYRKCYDLPRHYFLQSGLAAPAWPKLVEGGGYLKQPMIPDPFVNIFEVASIRRIFVKMFWQAEILQKTMWTFLKKSPTQLASCRVCYLIILALLALGLSVTLPVLTGKSESSDKLELLQQGWVHHILKGSGDLPFVQK